MQLWLFQNANYKFLELRRRAYVFSAVCLLIGIGAMVYNAMTIGNWQNYGIDFTGGTRVVVSAAPGTTVGNIRSALGGAQAPPITQFGEENEFIVRVPLSEEGGEPDVAADDVAAQLTASPDVGDFEILEREFVGPTIGSELQTRALLAIVISFVATLLYLAVRFELRFGLAAVIATVHDIIITLGFLALLRIEVSLPTVAAILTVIGYSLNDTIVVFDRIRENLNKKGGRREDQMSLINRSVNETLPRTLLTSGTTLVVLVALVTLGGVVIRDFALVLILGIAFGTYSSIFVASPALLEIQNRWGTTEDAKRKKGRRGGRGKKAIPV
jgi:preprotein translocase subunit SecF